MKSVGGENISCKEGILGTIRALSPHAIYRQYKQISSKQKSPLPSSKPCPVHFCLTPTSFKSLELYCIYFKLLFWILVWWRADPSPAKMAHNGWQALLWTRQGETSERGARWVYISQSEGFILTNERTASSSGRMESDSSTERDQGQHRSRPRSRARFGANSKHRSVFSILASDWSVKLFLLTSDWSVMNILISLSVSET